METATLAPDTIISAYQSIPIEKIRPSRHQARKVFDEDGIHSLAESMKEEGLMQPVTVRRLGPLAGSNEVVFELISGERRLRAAKWLGWTSIDAKIITTISEAAAAAKGLTENLQRRDLNPIEEAEGFQELNQLDPIYWTQEQIGKISGRGQAYVSQSIKLLGLPQTVKDDITRVILSRSHAELLLRLKSPDQQIAMAKDIEKHGWSVRETENKINQAIKQIPETEIKELLGGWGTQKPGDAGPQTSEPDPLDKIWKLIGYAQSFPGHKVTYLGNMVWSFEFMPNGAEMSQPNQGALMKELQIKLAESLIRTGKALQTMAERTSSIGLSGGSSN